LLCGIWGTGCVRGVRLGEGGLLCATWFVWVGVSGGVWRVVGFVVCGGLRGIGWLMWVAWGGWGHSWRNLSMVTGEL